MAKESLDFELRLADKISAPARAASSALKAVNTQLKAVKLSSDGIVPVRQIAVGSKASDKAIASEQAAAQKAANRQRLAEEKATARAVLAEEKKLQADKKAIAAAALAEWKAIDKRNDAQAKATAKAESTAAKDATKAKKLALQDASKAAKKASADQAAQGEMFAAQAAITATAAAAAAAAVLALAAAFTAAVYAGAKLALEASEAKNDTLDMLDAFLGSAQAANDTYDAIQDITRDVAISQGRAQELAQTLTAAGITNKDMLLDAIKSIGQVDSVIKGAGDKVQAIIERAQTAGKFEINAKQLVGTGIQVQDLFQSIAEATGKGVKQVETELKAGKISAEVGVAALTKAIDKKFSGLAGKQLLDFGNQMQRFKDNIGRLFEDVETGPFLDALKQVLDLFDESTTTGALLKEVLTGAFNGLFEVAAQVLPYVKTLLKGIIIIALQVYIGFKPLLKALGLIGSTTKDSKSGVDSFAAALTKIGEVAGFVSNIFAKYLAHKTILYLIAAAAASVVLPFVLVQVAALAALAAFTALLAGGAYVVDWLLNLGEAAFNAGTDLVAGLIKGIVDASSALIKTVTNLGTSAVKAFKGVFQISSPSKVMASVGENISLGLAQGIDAGAPAVNDNMQAVVSPPIVPSSKASSASGSASGSTTYGNITIQITITGVENAEQLEERMPGIMANALEQAVQTKGYSPSTVAA